MSETFIFSSNHPSSCLISLLLIVILLILNFLSLIVFIGAEKLTEGIVTFLGEYFFTQVFCCDLLLIAIVSAFQSETRHEYDWPAVDKYPENDQGPFSHCSPLFFFFSLNNAQPRSRGIDVI